MVADETDTRGTIPSVAIGLLVVVIVLGAFVPMTTVAGAADSVPENGPAAQESSAITIERTDVASLEVHIPGSEIASGSVEQNESIKVSVTDPDVDWSKTIEPKAIDPNQDTTETFKIDGALTATDSSLINATVTIRQNDATLKTKTLDLHRVTFSDMPGWTTNGSLYVPLNRSTSSGIVDEDTLHLETGSGETIDGMVVGSGTAVSVSHDAYVEAVENDTAVSATTTGGVQVSGANHPLAPDLRMVGEELHLWHPLVEAGSSYAIDLENGDDGEYHTPSVTAKRAGLVPLTSSLTGIDSAMVTLESGDKTLYNDTVNASSFRIGAEKVDDATVRFEAPMDSLGVTAVTVDETPVSGDAFTVSGQTLTFDEDVTVQEPIRVATDAGVLTVSEFQTGSEQSGFMSGVRDIGITLVTMIGLVIPGAILGFVFGKRFGFYGGIISSLVLALVILLVELARVILLQPDSGYFLLQLEMIPGAVMLIGMVVIASQSEEKTAPSTRPLTIDVTNGSTAVTGPTKITAIPGPEHDLEPRTETITDGRGRITLPEGRWTVKAKHGEHSSKGRPVNLRGGAKRVQLRIPLPGINIRVLDADRNEPLPGASVTMEAGQKSQTERTAKTGAVSFEPPADATGVTVTVSHEKYEAGTAEYQLSGSGGDVQDDIRLRPKTGVGELVARIDGRPTADIEMTVAPDEEFLSSIQGETTLTSGPDGRATTDRLVIGGYRTRANIPAGTSDLFETETVPWSVRNGETTTVSADIHFTWGLSSAQEQRIDELRSKARALTDRSGQDVAIPRYYRSVAEGILDAAESLPESGHLFARRDVHPDAVTDALLDATERTIDSIGEAMTTKRNVDLFAACTDMQDTTVRWSGSFDVADVVGQIDNSMEQRRRVAARVDEVAERIDRERNDLAEVAPAKEMLDQIRIDDYESDVETVSAMAVDMALLDAIEGIFENRPLRERLSQTVF